MRREELIRDLKYNMEKYENDFVSIFVGTDISSLCKDVLDYLEQEPCDDCISRQAAIDVVSKWFDKIQLNGDICLDGITSLPSVTPESKVGHWTERKKWVDTGYFLSTCSECGSIQPLTTHIFRFDYCPKCGAKMQESEE